MPKSLGQIHTIDKVLQWGTGQAGQKNQVDLPGLLSTQLQTMVRQGNYFKVVGMDLTLENVDDTAGASCSGVIRFYQPTRGRCEAYKTAFAAMMKSLKLQGVNVRGNRNYDFRIMLDAQGNYINGAAFQNQASFDGTNGLSCAGAAAANDNVFGVYNANIQPSQTAAVDFNTGFGVQGNNVEYVLNQGQIFDPSLTRSAQEALEDIPFQLVYDPRGTAATENAMSVSLEWRPDPALYLAVMMGAFEVILDNYSTEDQGDNAGDIVIRSSFHVAGWKSIMGNPDKKRRKGTRRKKKN